MTDPDSPLGSDPWPHEEKVQLECAEKGIRVSDHCCSRMAYALSQPVLVEHQGKNRILDWSAMWNEYRIPVPYDGYCSTQISYCPFCGSKLGQSRREQWYQELLGLGFTDPGEEEKAIPPEYEDDTWWRKRDLDP